MRLFVTCLLFLSLVGFTFSGVQLYRVKAETRKLTREIAQFEARQREARAQIDALRTEWAYLNAPQYLSRLVGAHDLPLVERVPGSFGRLSELPPKGAGGGQ